MAPFISILTSVSSGTNIVNLINNLCNTSYDSKIFELVISLTDKNLEREINNAAKKAGCNVKIIITTKQDKNSEYERLVTGSAKETECFWMLPDNARIKTKNWDRELQKLAGHFPDGIYKLKTSSRKFRNYYDYTQCLNFPETCPIVSRKWLEIIGGWGDYRLPEIWLQAIDYFVRRCGATSPGIFRIIPVADINIECSHEENLVTELERKILQSRAAKENFFRLASRINGCLTAFNQGKEKIILEESYAEKNIRVFDSDKKERIYDFTYALHLSDELQQITNSLPENLRAMSFSQVADIVKAEYKCNAGKPEDSVIMRTEQSILQRMFDQVI